MPSAVAVSEPVARADAAALAYAGLGVSTLGWAAGFVAGKLALAEMTPLPVAAWRYAAAATILLPFAVRQRPRAGIGSAVRPLLLMVMCGGVLYPVITHGDVDHLRALSFNPGDLLAIGAAATWAAFNLASRGVVGRLTPPFTNCVIYGIGGVALYVLGRPDHPWAQLMAATPTALGSVLTMAVLSSVVAGHLFLVGIRTVGVNRTVVFIYVVPVLTALLSVLLLGERFEAAQAVGGAAVLAGVWWTTRRAPAPPPLSRHRAPPGPD